MSFSLPDNMPKLNLGIPTERGGISNFEMNPDLLRHWIKELPHDNISEYVRLYMDALKRFNLNQLNTQQRLTQLDLYRAPLNNILFQLTPSKLAKRIPNLTERNKFIDAFSELLSELAVGFKIAVIDASENNANLKIDTAALLAINRSCEQLSYIALHAYKFHRLIPTRVLHELHQLYQLTMTANVEERTPVVDSKLQAESSFKQLYSQIMLVSICNPYGLRDGEALKAYHIVAQLADITEITPLPVTTKPTAGHFYVNCLSDNIPTPSVLPLLENQTQPPALIINTKPVLAVADSLFPQPKNGQDSIQEIETDLLKALIPYLNTSYERRQERSAVVTGNKHAYIATGLIAVHQCLNQVQSLPDDTASHFNKPWDILNRNSSGYLISQQDAVSYLEMAIGDFIGIFEPSPKGKPLARIAVIRWMKIDYNGDTKIGLSIIEGDPVPVHYTLDTENKFQPALFLPEISRIHQSASLITPPDVFVPNRTLTIRPKKKRFEFTMTISDLLNSGTNYKHFALSENTANSLPTE